jgi:predicted Zn finger-like uncharacterized protein
MTVRIQCPACQRQFKVNDELKGRTVECGACEKQFVVDADVIVPERDRYFPGDIKKTGLGHYGRAPDRGQLPQVAFATATYDEGASAADVIPASPQRVVASALGAVIQALFVVILIFGSQENGILKDMEHQKRIILAVFVAFVGAALLYYGGYHRMKQTMITGISLAVIVVSLAFFLPVPKTLDTSGAGSRPGRTRPVDPPPTVPHKMTELEAKEAMGYGPVDKAIKAFSYDTVVALWAPVMKQRFRYQIQRYLQRKTGTGDRPSFYPRREGGLIVLEGTTMGLPEIEVVVQRFGRVEDVYPGLRVIKIAIEGERLLEPSADLERKLNDKTHPAFYAHNQAELDHIDLDRMRAAAQRLASVEPKRFRPEIARRLVEMLQEDDDTAFRSTICSAIMVWSVLDDGAELAVGRVAQDLLVSEREVPRSMIEFLIVRKAPQGVVLLEMLWKKNPDTWEPLVVDAGADAESVIMPHLGDEDRSVFRSVLVILGRIGTAVSLPPLRKALEEIGEEEDMKVLIQSAIQAIEARE